MPSGWMELIGNGWDGRIRLLDEFVHIAIGALLLGLIKMIKKAWVGLS